MKQLLPILFFALTIASRLSSDVPLAVWSGDSYLSAQNVGISTTISYTDAELFLQTFLHPTIISLGGELSKYISNKHPEVIVLFVEDKLRSEQLSLYSYSFVNLMKLMENSSSSFYAPFVDLSVSFDRSIANMAYSTKLNSGKVFYIGRGTVLLHDIKNRVPETIVTSFYDFENILKSHNPIFSNGVTDLVVVFLDTKTKFSLEDKFSESDSILNRVQSFISSKTHKYVSAYTALAYDDPELSLDFSAVHYKKRYILQNYAIQNGSSNTSNGTIPIFRQYFGGWFWELFLVCLILIPLLVIGVYAIDAIQTPLFDVKPKPKK